MTPYQIAQGELGVSEIPGPKANKRIQEYHECTSLKATSDEVAWCSSFVNWCVKLARATYQNHPEIQKGLIPPVETKSAMARSWLLWGTATKDPQEGDIVIFSRGNDGVSGHVGFFVKRNPLWVTVLGGNQDNKVKLKDYPRARVLGYRTFRV